MPIQHSSAIGAPQGNPQIMCHMSTSAQSAPQLTKLRPKGATFGSTFVTQRGIRSCCLKGMHEVIMRCPHGGVHASLILKCRFTNFLHFFNRYPPLVIHRTPQLAKASTCYPQLYPQVLEKKAPDNPTRESLGLVMVHQSVHTMEN